MYRSRDGLWVIKHRYVRGYQAHHEWAVYAPDGSLFDRYTHGHHYSTLSDAVQAINEAVAFGVINMLSNLYKRLQEQEQRECTAKLHAELRAKRESIVRSVLDENLPSDAYEWVTTQTLALRIVDRLFGTFETEPRS